jgi:heme A synthase
MGTIQSSAGGAGLFFVFIFLSGIWLSRSGKPLNGIILTVHKLISLAAVVFLAITMVHQANQASDLSAMGLAAGAVTGLFFLGAILTGGLLSIGKPVPAAILTAHQAAPFLTVLSSAATLYLLS